MKKWYLIEEKNGDVFETELKAETNIEAYEEAERILARLSKRDRANETAEIVFAEAEDDIIDYDTAEQIIAV